MSENIIINGGADLLVTLKNGQTESVRVRLCEIDELGELSSKLDKEFELIEFVTGKPKEWVRQLTDDDVFKIAGKAIDINFSRLENWLAYRKRLNERFGSSAAIEGALKNSA